ncbi:MAG: hypothetical protein IJ583_04950 [Firmicutes bacterium]|nr:hypothetical protein [Bacillota bacterium]
MADENLFTIRNLISGSIKKELDNAAAFESKLQILLKLMDYESEYPDKADEIAETYQSMTGERYENGSFYISDDDREFLREFSSKTKKFSDVINLIDKICNSSNDFYDHDAIIEEATKKMSIITDIENLEFIEHKTEESDKEEVKPKKHIANIMMFRERIEQAKKKNN